MATWQFDLYAVPQRDAAAPAWILDFEPSSADWPPWPRRGDLVHAIDTHFARRQHWSPDTLAWGEEDGTSLELSSVGLQIDALFIRLDARQCPEREVAHLAEIGQQLRLIFVEAGVGRVIAPDTAEIRRALDNSSAAEFAQDPESFLRRLEDDLNSTRRD